MSLVLHVLGGVALGYVIITLAESFLHNVVQHGRGRGRAFWERHPLLCAPFRMAHYSHHLIHHCRTYRKDHVTQFRSQEEKKCLDATLRGWFRGELILRERYGTTIEGVGILQFILPVVPFVPLVYFLFGGYVLAGMMIPFTIYPVMSKYVHPYLHMRYADALRKAPPVMRWFLRTRYCRFIYRHHYLHHRYVVCNYNLLWGGDWLLGVHRTPTPRDLMAIRELGLPVD